MDDNLLINHTKKKLDELKLISEQPHVYMSFYFKRLKANLNSSLQKRADLLSLINNYETECLDNSQNSSNHFVDMLPIIHNFIRKQHLKYLNELIDSRLFKLKSNLFLNKSILLLKSNKFIYLTDEHISQFRVNNFINSRFKVKGLITREKIVLMELEKHVLNCAKSTQLELRLNNLTHLDLQRNKLTQIDSESFRHLVNLTLLNLSYNKIVSIGCNSFVDLVNLRDLNLSHNR